MGVGLTLLFLWVNVSLIVGGLAGPLGFGLTGGLI